MKRKRQRILFLIGVAVLIIGGIVFFLTRDKEPSYSGDYQESEQEDTVVYGGKEYRYNDHLSNYLFMGIDKRETEQEEQAEAGRADAIFLLSYDRVEKTLRCFSIPRDTIANVRMIAADGTDLGTTEDHINMQYAYGDGKEESCRLMKEAVSDMFYDIPIQGYCSLNMDGIAEAVDVIGGVELTVPDDSLEEAYPEYAEGAVVTITKDTAEHFVRYRDTGESQSALARTNRQKVFLKAFAESAKAKNAEDSGFIVDIYESLEPYMVTNMGNDVLAKLLQADFDSEIGMIDVPGEGVAGTEFDEYHIDETKLYELILQMFYEEV